MESPMSWLDTLEQIRKRDFAQATAEEREKTAREVINMCSYAAAVVSVSPLPFSDALLMLPIQSGMVITVGHIFGRKLGKAEAKDLLVELGTTAGVGFLARQGIKALLPVVGALITVPAAFAANWAIGRVALEYFRNPGVSRAYLKTLYKNAAREGAGLFSKERFDAFRKENPDPKPPTESKPEPEPDPEEEQQELEQESEPRPRPGPVRRRPTQPTVRNVLEKQLPERIAARREVAKAINRVIHLDLSSSRHGKWTLDLTRDDAWVQPGHHGSPAMTLRAKEADFLRLAAGELPAAEALTSGAVVLEPLDMELALQVGKLFG